MPKSHIEEYLGDLLESDKDQSVVGHDEPKIDGKIEVIPSNEKIHQAAWFNLDIGGLNVGIRARYVEDVVAVNCKGHESAWSMGKQNLAGRLCSIIDLRGLLMPAAQKRAITPRWAALIKDKPYAIACESHEIIEFDDAEICWRTENTTRPWLAGTVMAKKCALIHMDALLPILAGDGNIQ